MEERSKTGQKKQKNYRKSFLYLLTKQIHCCIGKRWAFLAVSFHHSEHLDRTTIVKLSTMWTIYRAVCMYNMLQDNCFKLKCTNWTVDFDYHFDGMQVSHRWTIVLFIIVNFSIGKSFAVFSVALCLSSGLSVQINLNHFQLVEKFFFSNLFETCLPSQATKQLGITHGCDINDITGEQSNIVSLL